MKLRCSCTPIGSSGSIKIKKGQRVVKSSSGLVVFDKAGSKEQVKCPKCGSVFVGKY